MRSRSSLQGRYVMGEGGEGGKRAAAAGLGFHPDRYPRIRQPIGGSGGSDCGADMFSCLLTPRPMWISELAIAKADIPGWDMLQGSGSQGINGTYAAVSPACCSGSWDNCRSCIFPLSGLLLAKRVLHLRTCGICLGRLRCHVGRWRTGGSLED